MDEVQVLRMLRGSARPRTGLPPEQEGGQVWCGPSDACGPLVPDQPASLASHLRPVLAHDLLR